MTRSVIPSEPRAPVMEDPPQVTPEPAALPGEPRHGLLEADHLAWIIHGDPAAVTGRR